jgi:O-antigen chain-terminating methyltransferase
VADLGCGRGEFLELLQGAGLEAIGVEINRADVDSCREQGFNAVEADLFDWLAEQEPGSLGGIFMAQVIEHLPPRSWSRFMELAATRLGPGGTLLVETINPGSLYALVRAYVLDPTHTRPAHPQLIAFLASRNGFSDVQVHLQADVPEDQRIPRIDDRPYRDRSELAELVEAMNQRIARLDRELYAPQEYAIVARKPAAD